MCIHPICDQPENPKLTDVTRRQMMTRLTGLGLSVPLAMTAISNAAKADIPMSNLEKTSFIDGLKTLIKNSNDDELEKYQLIELDSNDMPWKDINLTLKKGQQVTFLLGGRVWFSKEHDIWLEPGTSFNARSKGKRPLYNPMNNTGTMIASHDGPIEIARGMAEWNNEDGDLWTPEKDYKKVIVKIYGIALVWKGEALKGLKSLYANGDVGGVIGAEIGRLESNRKLPEGWKNFYAATPGPLIFNDLGNGEIGVQAQKNAGILQRDVDIELKPGVKLNWRWIIDELPSIQKENQLLTHDYLSIGAEYDDGQDLTYLWSHSLPVGEVFRCPFPRWTPVETHMIIKSGTKEIGNWFNEERDLFADYHTHIGGPAKKIKRVWLLGVSLFQRRHGACRFADIRLSGPGTTSIKL